MEDEAPSDTAVALCFTSVPLPLAPSAFCGRPATSHKSRAPVLGRAPCMREGGMGFGQTKKPANSAKSQKPEPGKSVSQREQRVAKGFAAKLNSLNRFKFTGPLRPGTLSPARHVPSNIKRPKYAKSGIPRDKRPRYPWDIEVKDAATIEKMRVAGRLAREVLDAAGAMCVVGATTDEIDDVAHREALARGAYPSPLNYNRFPKSCCTSINEVVCHGIPDDTVLCDGDIVNVDITVFYDGVHGDCSEMFLIGDVDARGRELVKATYDALHAGIGVCRPGALVADIGGAIEAVARNAKFSVVRNFVGHGIGTVFHTTPNVLHYKNDEPNGMMQPGMTFTIEPMLNEGTHKNITWPDDWTATTLDGKRSAQFEHTLLITDDGVEALTVRLPSSPKLFWET